MPARRSSSRRSPRRSIISRMPGSTISIAATSAARSPPISSASAARSRAGTSNATARASPSRCGRARGRHLYNTPPPTQGLASLIILALFERLRVRDGESFDHVHGLVEATKRAFACATASSPIPIACRSRSTAISTPRFLDAEALKIDRRKAAHWPAPYGEGRHDLDGRRRRLRARRLLHPVALLGVRLGLRAARDRRADAEPRRELLARTGRAERAGARPPAVPHAQSGARGARRWPRHGLRHHGRRRPAANPGRAVHPPRALPRSRSSARSTRPRWLLGRTWGSTHTNLRMESRFDGVLVDRLLSAGHDVEVLPDAYSDVMGHAGAVVLHPDGTLEGAPRSARRWRRGRGVAIGRGGHAGTVMFGASIPPQSVISCPAGAQRDWRAHP